MLRSGCSPAFAIAANSDDVARIQTPRHLRHGRLDVVRDDLGGELRRIASRPARSAAGSGRRSRIRRRACGPCRSVPAATTAHSAHAGRRTRLRATPACPRPRRSATPCDRSSDPKFSPRSDRGRGRSRCRREGRCWGARPPVDPAPSAGTRRRASGGQRSRRPVSTAPRPVYNPSTVVRTFVTAKSRGLRTARGLSSRLTGT